MGRAGMIATARAGTVLLALLAAGGTAARAADGLVERIEAGVYAAIDRYGSADLAAAQADIARAVPEDPLARALARALLEQARGRESVAHDVLVEGLAAAGPTSLDDPDVVRVTTAMLATLLDLGPQRVARRLLAASDDPLFELTHAALLSGEGRCAEALAIVERVRSEVPVLLEPALLVARTFERCERPPTALAWLEAVVEDPTGTKASPRVALAIGDLLLAAGDDTAAARWCAAARVAASPAAPYRHRAAACEAAAEAFSGQLPSGRDRFADALRDALGDGSVPLARRERAGLGAAWVLSASVDPGRVRDALDVLDDLAILPLSRRTRSALPLLRARVYARLERESEAADVLARAVVDPQRDPGLAALARMVRAGLAARRGEHEKARTLLDEAVALARRAEDPALAAEALLDAAPVDLALAGPGEAVQRVLDAVAAWKEVRMFGDSPYVDPAFQRRALEVALDVSDLGTARGSAEAGTAMLLARRILRRGPGPVERIGDGAPGLEDIRRALASRDATLVVFGIGLRRSFAWVADSTRVRTVALPRGDALFAKLSPFLIDDESGYSGPSSWGGQVIAGMLGSPGGEQTLYVLPDGFLEAVPWALLGGTAAAPGGSSGLLPPQASLPSLEALIRAPLPAVAEKEGRGIVLAITETAVVADSRTARWWDRLAHGRLESRRLVTGRMPVESVVVALRRPATLWTVRLPLLVAGSDVDSLALARRQSSRRLGPVPTIQLGDMLERAVRPAVLVMAPDNGWAGSAPASVVRAASRAVAAGVGASVVVLARDPALSDALVERIEAHLGAGRTIRVAVDRALEELPAGGYPFVSLIGDPATRIREPDPPRLKVWIPAGAGVLLVLVAILRAIWRRRDPFDVEPPEED